jgi:hypothetical protein
MVENPSPVLHIVVVDLEAENVFGPKGFSCP